MSQPDASHARPLFERCETWLSPFDVTELVASVSKAVGSGEDIRSGENWVEIRSGSASRYRIWGELFPWGRKSVPVMLRIEAEATGQGSIVHAHAQDWFGSRISDRAFFGAEKSFQTAISILMKTAEESARVSSKGPGPAHSDLE